MIRKEEGRFGCNQTTPMTSTRNCNSTSLAHCIKTVIVALTLWGVLPVVGATWIIGKGGLPDD